MKTNASTRVDVYQIITDRIIAQLEQNIVPWHKPWTESGPPTNLVSKSRYKGVNTLLLRIPNFGSNYFLTWNQLQAIGATVNKGEKSTAVVFWKRIVKQSEASETEENDLQYTAVLRYYNVFNVEQCSGIPSSLIPPAPARNFNPVSACEEIIERMPACPTISVGTQSAFYQPTKDIIGIPVQQSFENDESYYSVLFHELVHSTGHRKRLNRPEIANKTSFGSDAYSLEELTAEIGAVFLQSAAGIGTQTFPNNVAYIKNWLQSLRNDKRLIIRASSRAQQAADYILGVKGSEVNEL